MTRTPNAGPPGSEQETAQAFRSAVLGASRALATGDPAALGEACLQFCTTWLPSTEATLVELGPTGSAGGRWTITASHRSVRELCELDLYSAAGPCRACLDRGEAATILDLSRPRAGWERFATHTSERGFGWSLARPLRLGGALVGAMQLFGTTSQVPDEQELEIAHAVAGIAVGVRFQDRTVRQRGTEIGQLSTALASRVVIEQAKGILAERRSSDPEQAFASLRAHAREQRLSIHDVAREVVDGRDIPDGGRPAQQG